MEENYPLPEMPEPLPGMAIFKDNFILILFTASHLQPSFYELQERKV